HAAACGELRTHQEIAIAMHEINAGAGLAQALQCSAERVQPRRIVVIANPGFENVAEQVQLLGAVSRGLEPVQAGAQQIRLRGLQMQIGDEKRGHEAAYSSAMALFMTTSSAGTS